MKKLLSLLGLFAVGSTASLTVVGCSQQSNDNQTKYGLDSDTVEAISKVINTFVNDIKDVPNIDKELTYGQFFNIDGEHSDNFIQRYLYDEITKELKDKNKDDEYIAAQLQKVLKWTQDAAHLVYVDSDYKPQSSKDQKIIKTFDRSSVDKSLETLFVDAVKAHYPDADLSDPDFWKEHDKASLAVSFDVKIGDVELDANINFLTFTFATTEEPEEPGK